MAQYDFGTIDPNTKSGTALASDLNSWRNALHSTHGGSTAPTYLVAGMLWADTTSANYELKMYDGAQWIQVAVLDATNNVARVAVDSAETSYITSTTAAQIRHVIASTDIFTTRSTGIQFNIASPVIADSNNNELVSFTTTASAVNQINIANAATGGGPVLSAVGGDTNIDITLTPKGTGNVVVASGNVGIGVTPSAWGSAYRTAFQVGGGGSVAGSGTVDLVEVSANRYLNSSASDRYIGTGYATVYQQGSGAHRWYNAPSGTAGNAISFTQAMTLDASGNFYVGTTSQSGGSNITFSQPTNADMKIAASASTGTRAAYQVFVNNTVTTVGTENSTGGFLASGTAAYSTVIANNGAYPISFATNNTERARIGSGGEFLVGLSTGFYGERFGVSSNGTNFASYRTATSTLSTHLVFVNANGAVGSITTNGSGTAFNTSSDYRLKENVAPMQNALDTVAQLNPVTYNWKADGSESQGFIAHELQAVVPECVTGEKDAMREEQYEVSPAVPATYDDEGNVLTEAVEAVIGTRMVPDYQGIDTSFLVATLTKAIQEQQAIIADLTARVAALEA